MLGEAFSIPEAELSRTGSADRLLADTEQRLRDGDDPLDLLRDEAQEEMLGYFGATLKW